MSNLKTGLEYFSLNTDIELDDKITLIEAKHGAVGFTVIIKLWVKIYGDKGYYYDWNERTNLIFSKRANLDYEKVKEVVEDAIEFDLFDKKMFKKYGILTSKKIQENYLHATKRRNSVEIKRAFLLLNGSNVDIKAENVNIIDENDDILPHSIVKDSIVKDKEKTAPTPYQKIQDTYNQNRGTLPEVKLLSENRKDAIRLRYKKYGPDKLTALFVKAGKSDFLNGKNNNNWKASFDWLLKEANMVKVLEGNYDNKDKPIGKKYERVT